MVGSVDSSNPSIRHLVHPRKSISQPALRIRTFSWTVCSNQIATKKLRTLYIVLKMESVRSVKLFATITLCANDLRSFGIKPSLTTIPVGSDYRMDKYDINPAYQ